MKDEKILKEFYLIADELDKNIIRFGKLEEMLKIAKEENDFEMASALLKEYKEVSHNIKLLKEKSQKLKEEA